MYFLNSRYYEAGIGRFLTKDNLYQDLTNPHTLNRYTYTGGDPVNRFDPNGHFWFLLPFLGEGALMALVVIGNYFATVASAPDFQQDVQMTAMDLAEGNYAGAAVDVVSAAIPVVSAPAVKAIGKVVHGNSLKTTKAAAGYVLTAKHGSY